MGSVVEFVDLRGGVVAALRRLAHSSAGQAVIRIGDRACEVNWAPDTYHHHALLLPLLLLTAAINEGMARSRWRDGSFVRALDTAPQLDLAEKAMLLALSRDTGDADVNPAGDTAPDFSAELLAWVERFDLAGSVVTVGVADSGMAAHYGVRPVGAIADMGPLLVDLAPERRLAAVALLALYNGEETRAVFRGKRKGALNPPAVDAFVELRARAGIAAHAHLLRIIAACRGW